MEATTTVGKSLLAYAQMNVMERDLTDDEIVDIVNIACNILLSATYKKHDKDSARIVLRLICKDLLDHADKAGDESKTLADVAVKAIKKEENHEMPKM